MIKSSCVFLAMALWLIATNDCIGCDVLFVKALRDYDKEGLLGRVSRQEFETRMFTHSQWIARLYFGSYEPDINETLEVYSKPDGSRWLSYRRATPSLSRSINNRIWLGENFDLKKRLDRVRITGCEVALPGRIADEIELLWRTMLPGLPKEPNTEMQTLYIHPPAFIAFVIESGSVKTGRIAMAAYGTPAYREFGDIVDDLIKVCDPGASTRGILQNLSPKIRHLAARKLCTEQSRAGDLNH